MCEKTWSNGYCKLTSFNSVSNFAEAFNNNQNGKQRCTERASHTCCEQHDMHGSLIDTGGPYARDTLLHLHHILFCRHQANVLRELPKCVTRMDGIAIKPSQVTAGIAALTDALTGAKRKQAESLINVDFKSLKFQGTANETEEAEASECEDGSVRIEDDDKQVFTEIQRFRHVLRESYVCSHAETYTCQDSFAVMEQE